MRSYAVAHFQIRACGVADQDDAADGLGSAHVNDANHAEVFRFRLQAVNFERVVLDQAMVLADTDLHEVALDFVDLAVGSVIWGDRKPSYDQAPGTDPSSAVSRRCMIDTGANWCYVSQQLVKDLGLIVFDAPPPVTAGTPPKDGDKPVLATCITVVIGAAALPAAAYVGLRPISDTPCDVLLGTNFLRYFRFIYDGPSGTFRLGPVP